MLQFNGCEAFLPISMELARLLLKGNGYWLIERRFHGAFL